MSWADYYDWLYQSPPASVDHVVVGSTRATVRPLARWLACRWSSIENPGSGLSRALATAGWYPNLGPGNRDYADSFQALTPDGQVRRGIPSQVGVEAQGALAGRRFFQGCTSAYVRSITLFGDNVLRYVFPSRTIRALGATLRAQFPTTVAAWRTINNDWSPGSMANGVPYGPAPRAPIYGSHRDRVNGMIQLFEWSNLHPTGDPSSSMCRAAGIHYAALGLDRSVAPYVQPWF